MSDTYQAIYDGVRSRVNSCDTREAIRDAISPHFDVAHDILLSLRQEFDHSAYDMRQPHVLMRPTLTRDGDQWCALYGDDLYNGVAGFGDTPAKAMINFDIAWLNEKPSK